MHLPKETLKLLGFNPTGDLGPLTAYTSRRHGSVWFTKAPPLKPPSPWQIRQRDRFRLAAHGWRMLSENRRQSWHLAAKRARLFVHGYTLWVFWSLTKDRSAMQTIQRVSNVQLI